ncbi:MAG: DUF499 domain-containing protein [Desulfurococcaceae archaeon]
MTTLNAKPFTSILKPRREVLEGKIEEALNLANIYLYNELRGRHPESAEIAPSPLHDPNEFLKRTYISEEMKKIILTVMGGLAGVSSVYLDEKGSTLPIYSRIIVVPSALGGGKTHLLATLYHVARLYNIERCGVAWRFEDRRLKHGLQHACKILSERGMDIRIVAIVGDTHSLAPTPDNPLLIEGYRIHTPWGLLGYLVGEYDKLRDADEKHRPPDVDELRRALRDKPVLILMDEAVEYMVKAVRLDSIYRGYSEAFLSFIRNLAQAASELPGVVLIITVPAEFREGVIGRSYQHPDYVERILSMVQRVGPLYIPPLVFEKDISSVFKKRLFENADSNEARENARIVASIIQEKALRDSVLQESIKLKYGDISVFLDKLRECYPFHPYFIELAVNIALRNPGLGLTRYLLIFVSRLIKYIYDTRDRKNRDPPLFLITPWIIPIDDAGFRMYLLLGMMSQIQSEFQRIYEQDVRNFSIRLEELLYVISSPNREENLLLLRACIARTVWLSTIPGQGGKSSEALKQYPRVGDIPVMVYEPLAMQDVAGADLVNALRDLSSVSTYLTISHDDRVFYALMPDILAVLRQRYLNTTDFDALMKLEKLVHKKSFRPGRLIKKVIPLHTSREKEIEEIVREELERDSNPALVIYLNLEDPPVNIVEQVIRRNNVVLLLPDLNAPPEELGLHYTERFRRILGNEPPRVKDYLKSLLKLLKAVDDLKNEREYIRELAGEENVNYLLEVLDKTKQELERHIFVSIYSSLRRAVIGLQRRQYEVDLRPFEEDVKDLSVLSRLLEESLEKRGVVTEWSWSSITSQLREWSNVWDLDYSPRRPVRVGEIWNQLLYSPGIEPHLTSFEEFEKALEEAYLSNVIAFKHDDLVIWLKHPYTPGEAEKLLREKTNRGLTLHDWDGDVVKVVNDRKTRLVDLMIISPRAIIREYVEKIRKRAEIKPGEKVVKRLVVYTPSGVRELEEFIASFKREEELVDALSRYPVTIIEEKPSRVFQVHVLNVSGRAFRRGEPVELEFERFGEIRVDGRIEADEEFNVKIMLEAKTPENNVVGKPRVVESHVPGFFSISLPVSDPGEYIIYLRAEEPGGYTHPLIPVARVKVKGEVCREKLIKPSDLSTVLAQPGKHKFEVLSFRLNGLLRKGAVGDLYDTLAGLGRYDAYVSGVVEAVSREGEIRVEFKNTRSEKAAGVLRAIGVEDLKLNIEIRGLTLSKLMENRLASSAILDKQKALSNIVELLVKECVEV